ncbi:putative periplasmic metal-binding protein [Dietzia timorensis]|uniref:Putative periplasmic metal-binding protein n=1 Tax=Dietzia timorensis TaxID=499555 RepID=A0A173LGL9_9ACTN|nr:putative periplasmic metal-binding protein [Dietzia timorensis]
MLLIMVSIIVFFVGCSARLRRLSSGAPKCARQKAVPVRSPSPRSIPALASAAVLAAAGLAGCSSDGGDAETSGPEIVASTNVYGSLAEIVAGDHGNVESVIDDPSADPHSFEASPADAAKITQADLVVYNGAGYDEFVDQALENASDIATLQGVDAFTEATGTEVEAHSHGAGGHDHGHEHEHGDEEGHDHEGHDHSHGEEEEGSTSNEHVWYSLPAMSTLAEKIAEELATLNPADADYYRENAAGLAESLDELHTRGEQAFGAEHVHYLQTEPIGGHMFDDFDAHDMTPSGFTSAIEEGSDPSAADFAEMRELAGSDDIALLIVNPQTQTSATGEIADAAEAAGTPIVEFTETLPDGVGFEEWMNSNVDAVESALGGA